MSRLGLAGYGPFPTTYRRITNGTKIVVDGNSIWSNAMGPPGIEALPPLVNLAAESGCTIVNTSIAGQQWSDMATGQTDINAAWDSTKDMILMPVEWRNTAFSGKSVAQIIADFAAYCANALAVHPWTIVPMSGLPSDGVAGAASANANMVAAETYVRTHLAEFGCKVWCDFRDLSPFSDEIGTTRVGFMSSTDTCLEVSPGPYVHPLRWPRELIALRMSHVVRRIPTP